MAIQANKQLLAAIKLGSPRKFSKYRNKKITIQGVKFDSRKEAWRVGQLKMLENSKKISDLKLQVAFEFRINGKLMFKYIADATYIENGALVVEDVKSTATKKNRAYRIKKKIIEAHYGFVIKET